MSGRQLLDGLAKTLRIQEAWIITSSPRGGLQLIHPGSLRPDAAKIYASDAGRDDAVSWRVMTSNRVVRADTYRRKGGDGQTNQSAYVQKILKPAGLGEMAAAPLHAPVWEGFGGAIHLYRTDEGGRFTDSELSLVEQTARQMDQATAMLRASRMTASEGPGTTRFAPLVQIVLDAQGRTAFAAADHSAEPRVMESLREDLHQRVKSATKRPPNHRVGVTTSGGEIIHFHAAIFKEYPALSAGPVVFYCQEPRTQDWRMLRATDFSADIEAARLLPAMEFMLEDFPRRPTLDQIAKTVHLSPFHFHRRFTEAWGVTPKHFLLECQIGRAKRLLIDGDKDLVQIAGACGFAHQSHFTSRFKQATGLTPTRWRRLVARPRSVSQFPRA